MGNFFTNENEPASCEVYNKRWRRIEQKCLDVEKQCDVVTVDKLSKQLKIAQKKIQDYEIDNELLKSELAKCESYKLDLQNMQNGGNKYFRKYLKYKNKYINSNKNNKL